MSACRLCGKVPKRAPKRNWPQGAVDVAEWLKARESARGDRGGLHDQVVIYIGHPGLFRHRNEQSKARLAMLVPRGTAAREFDWPAIPDFPIDPPSVVVWCEPSDDLDSIKAFCAELVQIAYDRIWLFQRTAEGCTRTEYRAV